jgi:ribokinase
MFDVITIGSATRDVFLESRDFLDVKSREFPGGVGECLTLGSKNEVQKIFLSTGGGATNAAITFARLGLKTAVVARVGNDDAALEISKVLENEGVDTKFIQRDRGNSAYSTLLMHGPGERTVLVYRGPSNKIQLSRFRLDNLAKIGTKWLYVTSLGGRMDLVRQIWSIARRQKIKIAWNPGGEELKFGLAKLLPFIKQCEVFNINREEAVKLTGCDWDNLKCALQALCDTAKIVLVTDGKRGAYCCVREPELRRTLQRSERRKFGLVKLFAKSLGTKPRNTTGAGDAFGSGFVAGLILSARSLRGVSRQDGGRRGNLYKTIFPEPVEGRGSEKRLVPEPVEGLSSYHLELVEGRRIEYALKLAILNADSVIRQMGAKTGILKRLPGKKFLARVKVRNYS